MMKNTLLVLVASLVLAGVGQSAWADVAEPLSDPQLRALRPDAVRPWYIYNDANANGILDAGDRRIDVARNWWSPVASHTQATYTDGYTGAFRKNDDISSSPMNYSSFPFRDRENYWMPLQKNAIQFYMGYSQWDNCDFPSFYNNYIAQAGTRRDMYNGLYAGTNGWHLGWTTNGIAKDANGQFINDQTPAGQVKMDILVHNGRGTTTIDGWGTSVSTPQVTLSNDIDARVHYEDQYFNPKFNLANGAYDINSATNRAYMAELGLSEADFLAVVESMMVRQVDATGFGANAIWGDKTPEQLRQLLGYEYQDVFTDRNQYTVSTTDGGVIAGLAGLGQQVIRIDISPETLQSGDAAQNGNIQQVLFYDFGDSMPGEAGTQQTDPRVILLDLADTTLFPENRFFIAQVDGVPEPTSMAILLAGAGWILSRRRRRPAASR